ncbi:polysaccharide deacetylase family protein [Candidatus Woesearchaeota archaeon]|nr:polysaccharide deacetylase family protein [Candidatus Woesearchaeota archaeon]
MVSVCFYFQVHQPYRIRDYTIFDIGKKSDYFDEEKNAGIMRKVADKCYLPTNKVLLDLIKKHPEFRIAFSISGTALEQFEQYAPEVLESFKELVATGNVEMLTETYYHSLAFMYSKDEFDRQVRTHQKRIKELFGQKPTIFRNTELVYSNEVAAHVEKMGFDAVLCEGVDRIMGWRSPNFVYQPPNTKKIKLLTKNYKLSDDIAFRFSNRGWKEWPLTTEKFGHWISSVNGNGEVINLFMDYETFGEHQWEDTGIFEFLKKLPEEIYNHPDNNFLTPSQVIKKYDVKDTLDIPYIISWADLERDLSAWLGNKMQQAAIKELYLLEKQVLNSGDDKLIRDWRLLTTSDHFYYMCVKWFADGDVHKYFNAYDSPYDGFINYINVLHDIVLRLKKLDDNFEVPKISTFADKLKGVN